MFKEYVQESQSIFSLEMSQDMKRTIQYVNIAGNACFDVTNATMALKV
jgi:hypothetical protein